ncbi:MAG: prepilin-type N-terminal cleavage/methylation domain-containing protein [Candidatus Omnitrophota bacterium]
MDKRGLSIVELLVALTLFVIVVGALFLIITPSIDSFQLGDAQLDVEAQLRQALDTMTSELMQTKISKIDDGPVSADNNNYNTIRFAIPHDIDGDGDILDSGQIVEWSDQGSAPWNIRYILSGGQLLRISGGSVTVLGNHISSLIFRRPSINQNIIEISVTAERATAKNRQTSINLSSQIRMRN